MSSKMKNSQIETFKHRMMDPERAEKYWKILERGIHDICSHNTRNLDFVELYRNAFNMVSDKFGEKLYSGLVSTMTSQLEKTATSLEDHDGALFLEELVRTWTSHIKAVEIIQDVVIYMDRTFIPSTQKTPVHELGLDLWRDNIVRRTQIQVRLKYALPELVQRERRGQVINRGLMSSFVKMLLFFGPPVYREVFETPLLDVSHVFYHVESQLLIESCGCGDYLKETEKRLNEEAERVSHYLYPRTKSHLIYIVISYMIERHMKILVPMKNSGLVTMLMNDKYEDLARMYALFKRVQDGLPLISDGIAAHIRDIGRQLVSDPERLNDPVDFVQRLLDERDKYDKIINLAFNNDKMFKDTFNSSFEHFINLNPRVPEFISLFVDEKLREGLKGVSEEEVEIVLDKVIRLCRYLKEKDIFEKHYKQHLAKRLLYNTSVSEDAERSLISKLKTECGSQFTSKLEGMFTDVKSSGDTMKKFYDATGHELGDGPTLAAHVLGTESWPIQSTTTCNLPSEIVTVSDKFETYYSETRKRRVTWQTNMGSADIIATFGNGQKHELHVSTYQMCVLMLFNSGDRLSYKEIEKATNISTSDLKRCLQSLACIKGKNVLRKEPMSKDIGEDDMFFFNDNFSSEFYKVDVGTMVEFEFEKETRKRVKVDGKHQIDAAIVRIMKARGALDHCNLVSEVTKKLQSRFSPERDEIKKSIESLIEREFLKRDKADKELYRYLK